MRLKLPTFDKIGTFIFIHSVFFVSLFPNQTFDFLHKMDLEIEIQDLKTKLLQFATPHLFKDAFFFLSPISLSGRQFIFSILSEYVYQIKWPF